MHAHGLSAGPGPSLMNGKPDRMPGGFISGIQMRIMDPKPLHHVQTLTKRQRGKFGGDLVSKALPESTMEDRLSETIGSDINGKRSGPLDVLVAGGGPSGLALAAAMSGSGMRVGLVDPALMSDFSNNYGVWVDEFEAIGFEDCLSCVWPSAKVIFDDEDCDRHLNRAYGQVDKKKLKGKLMERCMENGVEFRQGQVKSVENCGRFSTAVCNDDMRIDAFLVVDATGFARRLLEFNSPDKKLDSAKVAPGYQVTYGILAEVESHPYNSSEEMVLMDWRSSHLSRDQYRGNELEPSFLYVMPFSDTLIFLEETSLVDRPAVRSEDLKERLQQRMASLNIKVVNVLEEERAMIPMGGALPVIPQPVLGVGGSAGMVHPSTGYMIARAVEVAPDIAKIIKPLIQRAKAGWLEEESFAESCWAAAWPTDERRQWDFMNLGMQILCELDPKGLRDFFKAFFALEEWLWGGYLSWRLSGIQCVVMGLSLLSVAPNQFRVRLIWTSLPFLPEFISAWVASLFVLRPSSEQSLKLQAQWQKKMSRT
ncbi:hypothetical protein BSKO_08365 [Bryopsis sp. KO-2023]|nr:hypothetical protein BSKO_08365 [Bryopsis sp. KO-2023]